VGLVRSAGDRPLRPGDVVEVRSAAEILASLDSEGALGGMPFMPEMVAHVGRRYTISRRVDKICDTVSGTGSRRTDSVVYFEDLRWFRPRRLPGWLQDLLERRLASQGRRRLEGRRPGRRRNGGARLARAGTRTVRELKGLLVATVSEPARNAPPSR
jgi:hypothetical protein